MPQQLLHLHQAAGPWADRGCGSALLMKSPIPNISTLSIVQTPCLSGSKWRLPCRLCKMKSCELHTFWLLKISLHLPCTLHPRLPSILLLFIVLPRLGLDAGFPLSCDEPAQVRGWSPKQGPDASHSKGPCFWQWARIPKDSLASEIFNAGASPQLSSMVNFPDWHHAVRVGTAWFKACMSEVSP